MTQTASILFFLRAYNDLDHFTPVIWATFKKGYRPIIITHNENSFEDDYRVQFLKAEGIIDFIHKPAKDYIDFTNGYSFLNTYRKRLYKYTRNPHSFWGKICRNKQNLSDEISFLKKNNVVTCVFEWGPPWSRGKVAERFFYAARGLALKKVCLPHGCNIFSNRDVNMALTKNIQKGNIGTIWTDEYDYTIFQNPTHRDRWVKIGFSPNRFQAWGSPRFDKEWVAKNLEICPKFTPQKTAQGRLKIAFMEFQSAYKVRSEEVSTLLHTIAENPNFHLIVKGSTRKNQGHKAVSFYEKYKDSDNVEFVGNESHSPSLIKWADCTINYGSSIGLEAIAQGKTLIHPRYLMENSTVFDTYGGAYVTNTLKETMHVLEQLSTHPSLPLPDTTSIVKEMVFGGKKPFDVLDFYVEQITSSSLNY